VMLESTLGKSASRQWYAARSLAGVDTLFCLDLGTEAELVKKIAGLADGGMRLLRGIIRPTIQSMSGLRASNQS